MTARQLLDLATAAGSGLTVAAVAFLIRLTFRRGKNLEDA